MQSSSPVLIGAWSELTITEMTTPVNSNHELFREPAPRLPRTDRLHNVFRNRQLTHQTSQYLNVWADPWFTLRLH